MRTEISITKKFTWVNVVTPTDEEITSLGEQFYLHPVIADELSVQSSRSRVESHDGYLFMVYHLPLYDTENQTSRRAEVDVVATEDTLITVSYEELEPIREFEQRIAKVPERDISSTAELVYHLVEAGNDFSVRQLRHVEEKTRIVGSELFRDSGKKLLEDIAIIKRDLLEFSLTTASQRVMLESLVPVGSAFWGEQYRIYLADLWGDFLKTHYLLENLRATIESYSETVSQLFQLKTAAVMRRFSILGFLTFPLILYATISLEPTVARTFIRTPGDFWLVFGIVAVFVALLAIVFRKKGWL
jgi:magnesium transporter